MSAQFDLATVAGGALQRKVNQAFERVVENMCDPNTSPDKKREIIIKCSFVQDSYGGQCNCQVSVSTKLAQALPVKTMFLTEKNFETGELYANEYGTQIPGQQNLEDVGITTTSDGETVDTSTGEILKGDKPVVDFRQRRNA